MKSCQSSWISGPQEETWMFASCLVPEVETSGCRFQVHLVLENHTETPTWSLQESDSMPRHLCDQTPTRRVSPSRGPSYPLAPNSVHLWTILALCREGLSKCSPSLA